MQTNQARIMKEDKWVSKHLLHPQNAKVIWCMIFA